MSQNINWKKEFNRQVNHGGGIGMTLEEINLEVIIQDRVKALYQVYDNVASEAGRLVRRQAEASCLLKANNTIWEYYKVLANER